MRHESDVRGVLNISGGCRVAPGMVCRGHARCVVTRVDLQRRMAVVNLVTITGMEAHRAKNIIFWREKMGVGIFPTRVIESGVRA